MTDTTSPPTETTKTGEKSDTSSSETSPVVPPVCEGGVQSISPVEDTAPPQGVAGQPAAELTTQEDFEKILQDNPAFQKWKAARKTSGKKVLMVFSKNTHQGRTDNETDALKLVAQLALNSDPQIVVLEVNEECQVKTRIFQTEVKEMGQ